MLSLQNFSDIHIYPFDLLQLKNCLFFNNRSEMSILPLQICPSKSINYYNRAKMSPSNIFNSHLLPHLLPSSLKSNSIHYCCNLFSHSFFSFSFKQNKKNYKENLIGKQRTFNMDEQHTSWMNRDR